MRVAFVSVYKDTVSCQSFKLTFKSSSFILIIAAKGSWCSAAVAAATAAMAAAVAMKMRVAVTGMCKSMLIVERSHLTCMHIYIAL